MSIESIITIALAIIAILATLFTKAIRAFLIFLIGKVKDFFHSHSASIAFRAFFLLLIHVVVLGLLYRFGIIVSSEMLVILIAIPVILVVEIYAVYLPIFSRVAKLETHTKALEVKVEVLNEVKKIELENILLRWPEFIKSLSDKPALRGVAAFLQLSRPVHIENDTLLIGVPEIVQELSDVINFEKITPQYQSFFGSAYKTRITVLKSLTPK